MKSWQTSLVAFALLAGAGYGVYEAIDDSSEPNRKIIFVQGIDSEATCESPVHEDGGFGELWTAISRASGLNSEEYLYTFSYSGGYCNTADKRLAKYNGSDTCSSIAGDDDDAGHSAKFGKWFAFLVERNKGAKFDIYAHSMGGVVVLNWAVTATKEELHPKEEPKPLDQVRAIVTLDSPLQGKSAPDFVPDTLVPCSGEPAIMDLQPTSNTIKRINDSVPPGECARSDQPDIVKVKSVKIITVRNWFDVVVRPSEACIAGPGQNDILKFLLCGRGWFLLGTNHDCVLKNRGVQMEIEELLDKLSSD